MDGKLTASKLQVGILLTTTWSLIPLSTSSSGPHKDIDDFVRLHVVVGLVTTNG